MISSLGGLLVGLAVGLRHAFEPDHLAAISTLVPQERGWRQGAALGAWWGLGHTVALLATAVVLVALRVGLPAAWGETLEAAVGAMLVVLGARALGRALRDGKQGFAPSHSHRGRPDHQHAGPSHHVHVKGQTVALRPLAVGILHGLAGSGALTAMVFAELTTTGARLGYVVSFGAGSIVGMAVVSAAASAALGRARGLQRLLTATAGAASIAIGLWWGMAALA